MKRYPVVNRGPEGGRRRQSTPPSYTGRARPLPGPRLLRACGGSLGPVPPAPPRPLPVSPAASRRLCPGPGRGARRAPGGGWRRRERPLDAAMPNALAAAAARPPRLGAPGAGFPRSELWKGRPKSSCGPVAGHGLPARDSAKAPGGGCGGHGVTSVTAMGQVMPPRRSSWGQDHGVDTGCSQAGPPALGDSRTPGQAGLWWRWRLGLLQHHWARGLVGLG
nr:translation initiation factor IF-2-like [Anser cygnoides]